MRILVAESDTALGAFLQRGFDAEDYLVDLTADGEEAKSMAQEREYDAAILDVNLLRPPILDVVRDVRTMRQHLPILVLSSRSRPEERVQVLDVGADDIVLKPFAFSELSARVRALLRRGGRSPETILHIEDLELNRVEHRVKRAGRTIELTPKEFSLLEYLMRNAGKHVSRAQIIEHVWNLSFDTMTNVVDVYINYSSAQVDQRKAGKLAMAIQTAFAQMGAFDSTSSKPQVLNAEDPSFSHFRAIQEGHAFETLEGRQAAAAPPDMQQIQKDLQAALAREISARTVSVTSTREGIVVSLRELGFFDSGSTALQPDAISTLGNFVKVAGPLRARIRIEGHTDNVPIHNARFDSNWELSTARATEITKLFVTKYSMAPQRLSASGYGEYYPVVSNDTPQGRAQNRRVDLVILAANADSSAPLPSNNPAAVAH
jgi:DNA-binding response OmpR family regulator/outer membrane protein OmpA-like peptidoglycan-associated protein